MSANRKLLTEIQQVLKKIEEGVELFDDIWGKVYAAEQQTLKEKYEADLKKEIKKLQRLRDQIKTWLGSSEIKDKNQLLEARKVIETKMEQFKVCERDTKTKAYSREGLARESRLDPKEAEREEKRAWTNECLDRLNDIVDAVTADVEKLSNGKTKGKNKEQIEKLENKLKKNKWHIARLEQIIKLIDNEELDLSKMDAIKDDVEYYIETALDDDGALGVDDEFDIYEELQLDAISLRSSEKLEGLLNAENENEETPVPIEDVVLTPESQDIEESKKKLNVAAPLKAIAAVLPQVKVAANPPKSVPKTAVPPAPPSKAVSSSPVSQGKVTPSSTPSTKSDIGMKALPVNPLPAAKESIETAKPDTTAAGSWASLAQKQPQSTPSKPIESTSTVVAPSNQPAIANATTPIKVEPEPTKYEVGIPSAPSLVEKKETIAQVVQPTDISPMPGPVLSMRSSLELTMLKNSLICSPESLENEKQSSYVPRNPVSTHPLFPTQPIAMPDNPSFMDKLPMDTLFLAFYYQQGSYQQYLAAKRLKQGSWRFHKKYLTWFQRHDEPKRTTDQYEEGTYVYFDYESGWCQRIKSEFKFEYAYLEDDINVG